MQALAVAGYGVSAALYLFALLNPHGKTGGDLLEWVSFSRLCLAEFLTVHAATLLGATVLVVTDNGSEAKPIFWALFGFYGLLAVGAYFMHRSNRALLAFFVLIVVRAGQMFTMDASDVDAMRAEVVKNFAMSVPMMLLVAGVAMSDDMLTPWQEAFLKADSWGRRIWKGRPLLFVAAYYALWALVELKWPERMSNG